MDMPWIWFIIAIACVFIEMITPSSLLTIFFSFGALFALLTSLFIDNVFIQTAVFLIVSFVSLLSMRPFFNAMLRGETVSTNSNRIIGTQFHLDNDLLKDKWYQQPVNNTTWSVISSTNKDISKGTLVEVISIDGVKLVVKPIKETN